MKQKKSNEIRLLIKNGFYKDTYIEAPLQDQQTVLKAALYKIVDCCLSFKGLSNIDALDSSNTAASDRWPV